MRFREYLLEAELAAGTYTLPGKVTPTVRPQPTALAPQEWWKSRREVLNRLTHATFSERPGKHPGPLIQFYKALIDTNKRPLMTSQDISAMAARYRVDLGHRN